MKVIFLSKSLKFDVDLRSVAKVEKNVFGFWMVVFELAAGNSPYSGENTYDRQSMC